MSCNVYHVDRTVADINFIDVECLEFYDLAVGREAANALDWDSIKVFAFSAFIKGARRRMPSIGTRSRFLHFLSTDHVDNLELYLLINLKRSVILSPVSFSHK